MQSKQIEVQHLPSDYPSDEAIMAEIAEQETRWGEERDAEGGGY